MKHYTAKLVPAHTKQVQTGQYCDGCGVEIPDEALYEYRDSQVRFVQGTSYPSGLSYEGWEIQDICPGCQVKLKEWLTGNGFTITPISE